MDVESMIMGIAKRNVDWGVLRDGDYIDEDGLCVCGTCKKRRETVLTIPDRFGGMKDIKVPCACDCDVERMKKEQEEDEKKDRKARAREWDSISVLGGRLEKVRFDDYEVTKDNSFNFKLCKRYVDIFDKASGQGLLMCGNVGTGKSFAAACIANELKKKGYLVLMTSFTKILEYIQKNGEIGNRLNVFDLVIFDDLGAERNTDYALEKVYGIIDEMYRRGKMIIYTTNLSLEQIRDEKDIRYKRLYDRILEGCYPMQFNGDSWRRKEAVRKFGLKELLEDNG